MPTPSMTRLVDNATFRLPGALPGALLPELFSVMDEFFQKTSCWTEDIAFTAVPTTNTILAVPEDYTHAVTPALGKVTRLMSVFDTSGVPVAALMPIPGEVILPIMPSSETAYYARVALTVADPVTSDGYPQVPDWVISKYNMGLLDGLLGRMMSQIAKPYSSGQMAIAHLRAFRTCISGARVATSHQNIYGAQNWRFPQTFNRAKPGGVSGW